MRLGKGEHDYNPAAARGSLDIPPRKFFEIVHEAFGVQTSDENILAAPVHMMLDSLGHQLGQRLSLISRVPVSFILAHLANIHVF